MKEFSTIRGELTDDRRRADVTFVEIEQIDAPLVGVWVVQSQCLRLNVKMLLRAVYLELLEVGIAIEKFLMVRYAVIRVPGVRAVQPVREPPNMCLPISDQEIKVMRTIMLRNRCRWWAAGQGLESVRSNEAQRTESCRQHHAPKPGHPG